MNFQLPFRPGESLSADSLNNLARILFSKLICGTGLIKSQFGDYVVLQNTGNNFNSGGGSNSVIPVVANLPAIPTGLYQVNQNIHPLYVLWADSAHGGTGDGQIWMTYIGKTKWYPLNHYTTKSGLVS